MPNFQEIECLTCHRPFYYWDDDPKSPETCVCGGSWGSVPYSEETENARTFDRINDFLDDAHFALIGLPATQKVAT